MLIYFFKQLSRYIRLLQTKRDSWLLWNRARDALNNTRQNLPPIITGSSDRLIVEHHLLNNPQLQMAKTVQEWLQPIKLDQRYQTGIEIAMAKLEPKRIYWEKTCHFLKSSYNTNLLNPYVICLAKNLCKSTGYHWLATILSVNELYHDENSYSSQINDMVYPVEGNQKGIEWVENMLELCMDMGLKLFERAIYGLLCGRLEALTPVCKTYADYLWTYTSCYIEQEIHSILVSTHGAEVQKALHRLQMTMTFS